MHRLSSVVALFLFAPLFVLGCNSHGTQPDQQTGRQANQQEVSSAPPAPVIASPQPQGTPLDPALQGMTPDEQRKYLRTKKKIEIADKIIEEAAKALDEADKKAALQTLRDVDNVKVETPREPMSNNPRVAVQQEINQLERVNQAQLPIFERQEWTDAYYNMAKMDLFLFSQQVSGFYTGTQIPAYERANLRKKFSSDLFLNALGQYNTQLPSRFSRLVEIYLRDE